MIFDEAAAALDAILDSSTVPLNRNEAQTRFDLIDRLLKEALAWPPNAIHVERDVSPGYTDYELGTPGTVLIVEAKREGATWVLPEGLSSGVHSLNPILRDPANAALKKAMSQVIQYCAVRGVSPAVVTNGHQWVAFLASRADGVAPLVGKGLFFSGLESIRDDFLTFWNHLSSSGISARRPTT